MAADPHPAIAWLLEHRRRLAPLVLIGGVVLVAGPLLDTAPRSTNIRLKLSEPQQVRSVTLSVLDAGEPIVGLHLAYEQGAPDRINEELDLAPGHYEVRIDITRAGAPSDSPDTAVRRLDVPSDGTVLLDLSRGDA